MGSHNNKDVFATLFALIDSVVELYLAKFIKPFLTLHEKFYNQLNATLRKGLDDNEAKIPVWFTANFITYFRTVLVIPTIMLLVKGHTVWPSLLVLFVDFGDFLDGVVARFWVDVKKEKAEQNKDHDPVSPSASSDKEGFGKGIAAHSKSRAFLSTSLESDNIM